MKLDCNFEIYNNIIRSETYLEQIQDDCSVLAPVFPCEIIPNLTSDCSLVSVIGSSDLLLDKTSGIISEEEMQHIIKGNTQECKVKLASAKLVSKKPPKAQDIVLVQIYLTNIPYPFKPLSLNLEQEGKEPEIYQTKFTEINITEQPKIKLL